MVTEFEKLMKNLDTSILKLVEDLRRELTQYDRHDAVEIAGDLRIEAAEGADLKTLYIAGDPRVKAAKRANVANDIKILQKEYMDASFRVTVLFVVIAGQVHQLGYNVTEIDDSLV